MCIKVYGGHHVGIAHFQVYIIVLYLHCLAYYAK